MANEMTATEAMIYVKEDELRTRMMAELERHVDREKPGDMSFFDWFSSSARARLVAQALDKWASEQYAKYVSGLAAL